MNLQNIFKAVLESDVAPIVVCDMNHIVVYMNKVAKTKYKTDLTGKSLVNCHNEKSNEKINRVIEWFKSSDKNNRIYTYSNQAENRDVYMVALRDEDNSLIGYYEKHEFRTKETSVAYEGII